MGQMKKAFIVFVVLIVGQTGFAQQEPELNDSTKKPMEINIGVGVGIVKFMGDVQDASEKANVHLIGNRAAYDLSFGFGLSRSFILNVNGIYGKLSGNENTFRQNRNFESQMVQLGLNVEYNFAGLYKKRLPVLSPFILGGIYYSNYFNVTTDLVGNGGTEYHYWSDGKIRTLAEDAVNAEDAENMSRDYTYETSLVKKAVNTGSVSAGFGVDLHLSRALSLRLMSRYFHSFSDDVDGFNDGSFSESRDGFFFTTASLVLHPMALSKQNRTQPSNFRYLIDFKEIEQEDSDGDGVYDTSDKCAATPKGVKVDRSGCPADSDKDGVPDYRDKSPQSEEGQLVDQHGSMVDYELVAERWSLSPNVYGINWDKKYENPRFAKNQGFTVNVASGTDTSRLNRSVLRIPELRKQVINDSLIIYRLGTYDKFEYAEAKSRELNSQGETEAYGVAELASIQVAEMFLTEKEMNNGDPNQTYLIKESIASVKTSEAHNNPQLDYAVSRFERYLFEGVPESALLKDYLRAILPFAHDPVVATSMQMVQEKLDQYPVARVPVNFSASESVSAEPNQRVESAIHAAKAAESEANADTGTANLTKLEGEELQAAIQKIRESSQLKKKPRINYAPVSEKFRAADINNDRLLSASEVQLVLEEIVAGKSSFTTEQFNEMNTYFTEFTSNVETIDFGGTKVAFVNGVLTILKTEGGEFKEESRRLLAKKYREADFNGDGELTPEEVQKMIALFLKGGSSYSQEKVHELIDLYFE
jgi:hypothetical protein